MIKSKKLQKIIGLFVAAAVATSMSAVSFTASAASEGARWSLVNDATNDANVSWRHFGQGTSATYPDLSTIPQYTATVSDGVITYDNFTGTEAMFGFECTNGKENFFKVEEGDVLNVNVRYDTPEAAPWSWTVEIYNKGTSSYVNLGEEIAADSGAETSNGNLTTACKDLVASIDLAEVMGVGTEVNYIRFYTVFGSADADVTFTVKDFSITNGEGSGGATQEYETLYAASTDSLDGWLTYDENFPETAINAYVSPIADGSDPNYTGHMKGNVVTDGIEFTFTDEFYASKSATNTYGSFVRQFNNVSPYLCTVDNNSYLNLHFKLEADSSIYGIQLYVRVGESGEENLTPFMANLFGLDSYSLTGIGADGAETSLDGVLPAGEYTMSVSFKDLMADYPDQAALLADGAPFVFHQLFVRASDECSAEDEVKLTVYDVSVTTGAVYAENKYDDLSGNTTTVSGGSTSTGGGTSTSSKPSSNSQVDTGENMLPVIGIAALAVVATSAVIISKKRK
ncbi:MAG TPA: hypothetical protein H9675_05465 [Firmicutes bacterium]|nr:hypothetical protein [Bacillota bacterium]